MNNKWMTDIKRKADSYERKAPDDMLDNIKQEMARRGLTMMPPQPVAQTHRLTWQRWAVAASLAAVVGGTAIYLTWQQPDSERLLSQQPQSHRTQQQRQIPSTVGRHAAGSAHVSATNLFAHNSGVEQGEGTMTTRILPSASITTDENEEKGVLSQQPLSANGNTIEKKEADRQTPKQQPSANHPIDRYQEDWKNSDQLLAYDNAKSGQSMHVSAYYQGVGGFQNNGNGNGNGNGLDMAMSDPLVASMPILYAYPTLLSKAFQETPIHSEKHHHLPVRAGVSVSIPVNERWGVTTGLTYSTMSSDFEDLYANHSESSTQRLHYLGIPVSVRYNVWQQSKVKIYASAGGEIEKLVYGKKKTHYDDMASTKSTSTTVSEHRPVLSTNVNAGISYSILPNLSVFAEPGLAYYFKNGSGVKSAYTDKQLLFNVNVGVRFGK